MIETFDLGFLGFIPNLYLGILAVISLYGFHKILMVWRFYRHRDRPPQPLKYYADQTLPKVTIQLPIFNEMYVAERLLEAVSRLDYPTEKLEIQVLDDSTDHTQSICREKVLELKHQPLNIHYLHRQDRHG
ncbi:MAG: glycosyltransferase family 2 protein, partial [Cyanobacteria bacterium]|nr:glycosyltransferase family 2 protein [Cyanobacteriota bacterium]